ncbi:MAG: hypothetical protein QNJ91_15870 [Gammaproteobacteria bacterium]|nr:hypothetical protein [Gammaproteobacteria bacterium]
MPDLDNDRLIQTGQLNEYFHHAVHAAADRRHLAANQATLHYLTLLLSQFARSEQVFDYADGRLQVRPLALLYGDALAARSERERRLWLQRLGDLALFIGGLFAGRLNRHFSDLDYCVAMGGNAYGYLQQTAPQADDRAVVFGELADGFAGFVDVVAVVTGKQGRGTRA